MLVCPEFQKSVVPENLLEKMGALRLPDWAVSVGVARFFPENVLLPSACDEYPGLERPCE